MNQDNISFDLPKNRSNVIKVIGVGGGGSNAVNYMYKQGFKGVDFVVCNTDAQALHSSPVPNKVQLGVNLTEGLGAGASPEVGGEAAIESLADLESMLSTSTKMLFLTAGMGGGTGTGAAPVIAKLAAKLGILTVGIVTMPFKFEGAIRLKQAQEGMELLSEHVDSMIVINNNKLRDVYGNLGLKSGFAKADEVLATAARGISEVITNHSGINIDLRDAKTVLENSGSAIMGAAIASGDDRAKQAISKALDSPLLNDNSIRGAKQVLLLIVSGETEITFDEMGEINEYIQDQSGGETNIIMGAGEEEGLGDSIKVTIVATGFSRGQQDSMIDKAPEKKVYKLVESDTPSVIKNNEEKTVEVETVVKEVEPVEEPIQSANRIVHTLEEETEEVEAPIASKVVETPLQVQVPVVENKIESPIVEREIEPTVEAVDKTEVDEVVVEEDKSIMNISDDDIVIQDMTDSQTAIEFDFGSINNANIDIEEVVEEVPEKMFFDLGSEIEEEVEEVEQKVVLNNTSLYSETENISEQKEEEPQTFIDGSIRYNLEDFEELEEKIKAATPTQIEIVEEVEPEMQIHIVKDVEPVEEKVMKTQVVNEPLPVEDFQDPTDIPLSKREQIGKDRRERLKKFNHNFKTRSINHSSVDDLERQPAYLRAGIDLTSSEKRTSASRYSIGGNSDEDVVLRKNNSFLHDNVD